VLSNAGANVTEDLLHHPRTFAGPESLAGCTSFANTVGLATASHIRNSKKFGRNDLELSPRTADEYTPEIGFLSSVTPDSIELTVGNPLLHPVVGVALSCALGSPCCNCYVVRSPALVENLTNHTWRNK